MKVGPYKCSFGRLFAQSNKSPSPPLPQAVGLGFLTCSKKMITLYI